MLKRYKKFAELAYKLAVNAMTDDSMKHSMCALVVRKNKVISVGYNKTKTHPESKTRMFMCHAEFDALRKHYQSELKGCDIVVVRVRRSGFPGLAKPCKYCESLIVKYGIQRTYWSKTGHVLELEQAS